MNVLIIRYRLECTIHLKRQNQKVEYLIYIREGSMALLRSIVIPFMHPSSMYYQTASGLLKQIVLRLTFINLKQS